MPESSIFKIPQTARADILCYEGLKDPVDEFKPTVEKRGLTGIKFRELWQSDARNGQSRSRLPASSPTRPNHERDHREDDPDQVPGWRTRRVRTHEDSSTTRTRPDESS